MAAATNEFETRLLGLILSGTSIAGIADNDQSSPLTAFGVALHTASPGENAEANTNEATYTGYTRVAYPRDSTGWTIAGSTSVSGSAAPTTNITFPQCTAGTNTITHWSLVATTVTGTTGTMFMYGTLTPTISVSAGVTPRITTASAITII